MVFCALKRRNVTDFTSCAACSEAARHTAPAPELWATSVPILVFLGLSVLDLGARPDVQDRRQTRMLNAPTRRGGGIITT